MRKLVIGILLVTGFGLFALVKNFNNSGEIKSPIAKEKPLDKYTFVNLKKTKFAASDIVLGESLKKQSDYISQIFYYNVDGKKVS